MCHLRLVFSYSFSLWIICPLVQVGVLKSPTVMVLLLLSLFRSVSVCLMYLASLVAQWQRIRLQCRRRRFDPWIRRIPWRRKWQATPVFLPREFRGLRTLVGYSPQGHKQLDTTDAAEHTPMLVASIFTIVRSSFWIDPMIIMQCPYLL